MPRRPSRGPSIVRRSRSDQHALAKSVTGRDRFFADQRDDGHQQLPDGRDDDGDDTIASAEAVSVEQLFATMALKKQKHPSTVTTPSQSQPTSGNLMIEKNNQREIGQMSEETMIKRPALKMTYRESILSRGQNLFKDSSRSRKKQGQEQQQQARTDSPKTTDGKPMNNAKWSKPQPPTPLTGERQRSFLTPKRMGQRCRSVGKGSENSGGKVFAFDEEDYRTVVGRQEDKSRINTKGKEKYPLRRQVSSPLVDGSKADRVKRPSTATPQVEQVQKKRHSNLSPNQKRDDSDSLHPPPPPHRSRSCHQLTNMESSRNLKSPYGQFDDASEIPTRTDVQGVQFDDASEGHSVRSAPNHGLFDDASEMKVSQLKFSNQRSNNGKVGEKASARPTTPMQIKGGAIAGISTSSAWRKTPMSSGKASLLRGAVMRVRSITLERKKAKKNDNPRGYSLGVSVSSLSPFWKKGANHFSHSPVNNTPFSGSTISSISGTHRTGRSETSVPTITRSVSNAETERARNISFKKTRSHNNATKANTRVPSVPRHSVNRGVDGEKRPVSSIQCANTKDQRTSPSSSSSNKKDQRRTEYHGSKSRPNHAEMRQSDEPSPSSESASTTSTTMSANPKSNRVRLHVYDLVSRETQLDLWGYHFPLGQCFNAVNSSLHNLGTGAYHVGVEVNGVEYAYGSNSTMGLTGVFTCVPKNSPGYQYRTTIDFGERSIPAQSSSNRYVDGREIVRAMASQYMGIDYDLLRKNCCTFATHACVQLGIAESEIPSWFHNLAATGAMTQDAANSTLAPITSVFSACEVDGFARYISDGACDEGVEMIEGKSEKVHKEQLFDTTTN